MWHNHNMASPRIADSPAQVVERAISLAHAEFESFEPPDAEDLQGFEVSDARKFAEHVQVVVETLNRTTHAEVPSLLVVQDSFSALLAWFTDRERSFRVVVDRWAELAGAAREVQRSTEPLLHASWVAQQQLIDVQASFQLAVEELLRAQSGGEKARLAVRSLMSHLDLSFEQIGRMFKVSGETARRWSRGSHPVPSGRVAQIAASQAALDRLLSVFRPEALPGVIRRQADLFEGETALDWILRGRIDEVADRYESTLAYQM